MLSSFVSFLFAWKEDMSLLSDLWSRTGEARNWLSRVGAWLGHTFVYNGFGLPAISLAVLTFLSGYMVFNSKSIKRLASFWTWGILVMIWLSVVLGFFNVGGGLLGGRVGFELNAFLQDYLGMLGAVLLLGLIAFAYAVFRLGLTRGHILGALSRPVRRGGKRTTNNSDDDHSDVVVRDQFGNVIPVDAEVDSASLVEDISEVNAATPPVPEPEAIAEPKISVAVPEKQEATSESLSEPIKAPKITLDADEDLSLDVEVPEEEEEIIENKANQLVHDFGEFDPTLELSRFQFPPIDLLKDHSAGKRITINEEELQENKDNIVQTLKNYGINIAEISATVGPTVTLYEIIPEAGVRISKIKNLEDDIALSLAALGIRIIAPIPGRGTIGIEVPNKNPSIVSMRTVIASKKFQDAGMELPLALGKTISNETLVVDLAKMPHLLMAGATGQGKSVGLNAIIASLLYKKHPAEIKFVLVDPKKVELTLFNKIERHYLAMLPDSEEAIITDNTKVINTLNSLCIEMDNRYDLLKNAMVRNLKEYNAKFRARKLNPNDGHRFLPYIVVIIDEFADLIMTAGKEVETPVARLAQLARAIGIHLIIATQRPSVNVITGTIKANFPARIAFRVSQKIDSRTILDASGADQLIGRGDMLYNSGNSTTRIQCAFVDTPEVEKIVDYIGNQKAYPQAYQLPEYVGEDAGTSLDIDKSERDKLFREAAEVLVTAQQGSASLLQRKLKLGYNRAGRLIDQLEAAGIVGPFEGSKARSVLIPDLAALDAHLAAED